MHHVGYDHGRQDGAPAGLHDHHTQDLALLLLYEDLKGETLGKPESATLQGSDKCQSICPLPAVAEAERHFPETPTLWVPSSPDSMALACARTTQQGPQVLCYSHSAPAISTWQYNHGGTELFFPKVPGEGGSGRECVGESFGGELWLPEIAFGFYAPVPLFHNASQIPSNIEDS